MQKPQASHWQINHKQNKTYNTAIVYLPTPNFIETEFKSAIISIVFQKL